MTPAEFRAALKALGLSQRSFASAERMGLNVHTVNRWALGTLPVPRYAQYTIELLISIKNLTDAHFPID